jgi:hypothetical protein
MEGFEVNMEKAAAIWQSRAFTMTQKKLMVNMLMQQKSTAAACCRPSIAQPTVPSATLGGSGDDPQHSLVGRDLAQSIVLTAEFLRCEIADRSQQPCATLHKALGVFKSLLDPHGLKKHEQLLKSLSLLNHAYTGIHHMDRPHLVNMVEGVSALLPDHSGDGGPAGVAAPACDTTVTTFGLSSIASDDSSSHSDGASCESMESDHEATLSCDKPGLGVWGSEAALAAPKTKVAKATKPWADVVDSSNDSEEEASSTIMGADTLLPRVSPFPFAGTAARASWKHEQRMWLQTLPTMQAANEDKANSNGSSNAVSLDQAQSQSLQLVFDKLLGLKAEHDRARALPDLHSEPAWT